MDVLATVETVCCPVPELLGGLGSMAGVTSTIHRRREHDQPSHGNRGIVVITLESGGHFGTKYSANWAWLLQNRTRFDSRLPVELDPSEPAGHGVLCRGSLRSHVISLIILKFYEASVATLYQFQHEITAFLIAFLNSTASRDRLGPWEWRRIGTEDSRCG